MKKYIPVDFDEKGNAVLGREKNTPTSNSFIPTTWAPGGSEGKQGVKSISISPAITTDPALDSFTIYWEDLTEEEKQGGEVRRVFSCPSQILKMQEYTVTLTPTETWAIDVDGEPVAGEPVSVTELPFESGDDIAIQVVSGAFNLATMTEGFNLVLWFVDDDPK